MNAPTCGFQEIEDVYATVAGRFRSIAITSPGGATGTTTLIRVLGTRFAAAGRSTLLVDLNTHRPHLYRLGGRAPAEVPGGGRLVLRDAPRSPSEINALREPGVLEDRLSEWCNEFDVVLLDTAPVNRMNLRNVPAERIANACDATLMVVMSGVTPASEVSRAVDRLGRAGAALAGTVLNEWQEPGLREELLRQTARFERFGPAVATAMRRWIGGSALLAQDP